MNVGVIGTGVMGKNHVRVYSRIRETENIYIFDPVKSNTDALKRYGVIVCSSIDEVLQKVDVTSICVPTKHHFKVVSQTIQKNIHCLVEKPITSTIKEGNALLKMCKDEVIVGVGHIERFNPIVEEIRKIVKNIRYCEIKRCNPGSKRINDINIIKDLMIHDIDIVFNVLFPGKEYQLSSIGNRDVCSVYTKFDDSVVSITASKASSKKIRTLYVEDKEFTVEGDFMLQEVYVYWKPERYTMKDERYLQENIIEKVLLNKVEPLYFELETFLDCVKNHKPFPITFEQGVNNLKICEEIEKGCQ
jgi:predicted dehydrogenase